VTVPDAMGLDDRLQMQGLVYRVLEAPGPRIDVELTRRNLHEVFRYESLLLPDPGGRPGVIGVYDSTVYKDANARLLTQNYAAAFSRLAIELYDRGLHEDALVEIENAAVISTEFSPMAVVKGLILEKLTDDEIAGAYYREQLRRFAGDPEEWQFAYRLGVALVRQKRYEEAVTGFERAITLAPERVEPYQALLSTYYSLQRYPEALGVLERWLEVFPEDQGVRLLYRELLESVGEPAQPPAVDPGRGEDE
jgi:tetratricopeptide (TPR) repeat protein